MCSALYCVCSFAADLAHAQAGSVRVSVLPSKCQPEGFMRLTSSSKARESEPVSLAPRLAVSLLVCATALLASCSGVSSNSAPQFSGNTQVTVALTSTANDQLTEFNFGFTSITLTSRAGAT